VTQSGTLTLIKQSTRIMLNCGSIHKHTPESSVVYLNLLSMSNSMKYLSFITLKHRQKILNCSK